MDNPLFRCDPNRLIVTPYNVGHSLEIGPAGVEMAFPTINRVLEGELPGERGESAGHRAVAGALRRLTPSGDFVRLPVDAHQSRRRVRWTPSPPLPRRR